MENKYYKTWEDILEENNDTPQKNKEAMYKKMMASEEAVFNYVINLLL
ncbi:MAG: hypothetical protein ACOWWR_09285 [Eubacteriales bacterium]